MWVVFVLIGAVLAAISTVLSKAGLKNVDPSVAFAVQSVLIIIVSWGAVAAQSHLSEVARIDKKAWIFLTIAGVATAFSSLFTFRALKVGEASMVSPLERVSFIFAIILAAIFLKEKITLQIAGGGALILAGALIIAFAKKTP